MVLYWQGVALVLENYLRRSRTQATPLACAILHFCSEWRSARQIAAELPGHTEESLRRILELLRERGFLERAGDPRDPQEQALNAWESWNPAAGFFHFSTKDVEFTEDPQGAFAELAQQALANPMPFPGKRYTGRPSITLPQAMQLHEQFPRVLRARRTWRRFAAEPVPLATLSALLQLTFGIQQWCDVPGLGRVAVKTSPSGGSLHPIEAYVVARNVRGLKRGIYYYNAAKHALERICGGVSREFVRRELGHQEWFADCAFLVLMTAVFARTRWKYDYPRVYRAVLLEAGHLCQTFCLTATWLGLAPFQTIAATDTKWEKRLGIDGVNESLIYAAGAGMRPKSPVNATIENLQKEKLKKKKGTAGRKKKA